jgi:hypothetical protein
MTRVNNSAHPAELPEPIHGVSGDEEPADANGALQNGAAPESNRASVGLPHLTGFEDRLGHRARATPKLEA